MNTFKRTFCAFGIVLTEVVLVMALQAPSVRAASDGAGAPGTHVSGHISASTVWQASGSPYIFDGDVTVDLGAVLDVGPGVRMTALPGIDPPPSLMVMGGRLNATGTADLPVDVSGITKIFSSYGKVSIDHMRIHDGPTLIFHSSEAVVNSSVVSRANGSAIYAWGSKLDVSDTKIEDSSFAGIIMSRDFASGDISNVTVHGSSFVGNARAFDNESPELAHAEGNWWGSSDDPGTYDSRGLANNIRGSVSYTPWLMGDPLAVATSSPVVVVAPVCCSNVLFLPGLEGTQLYSGQGGRLWEPGSNADVHKLYLDPFGSSTDPAIYSGGPISKAYGLKDVYGGFMSFLDSLKQSGSVNEARAFGYDWRKPIDQVVLGVEKKATTSESLADVVAAMASTSKTGKVTLVAHSNGGLVAKYLVKTLADMGKASLIDKVISVAVPYLGTPEAIIGLLHGDHQSILGGLIESSATARGLGVNMPSAYSLLPTAAYFQKVLSPTIVFASTTVKGLNDGSYGKTVGTASGQTDFILDANHIRMQPAFIDLRTPSIGSGVLLHAAESLHNLLDPYEWPANIASWAIVGWNEQTTKGVEYSIKPGCGSDSLISKIWCRGTAIVHKILASMMGDGTVVAPSAAHASWQTVSLDLDAISKEEGTALGHSNILESSTTQSVIRRIVTGDADLLPWIPNFTGMSLGEPDYSKEPAFIVVVVHSAVELHAYDAQGRHTGPVSKPAVLTDNDYISGAYETGIPGSYFQATGGEDGSGSDTYIRLPDKGGARYSVVVKAKDFGFFTLGVERVVGGNSADEVSYTMSSMSPLTVATTTVGSSANDGSYLSIASTTPAIHVDVNGDGSSDSESLPGGNGLPGNATTTSEAERIALEQSRELILMTDTDAMRTDPRRLEFMKEVAVDGGNIQNGTDGQPTLPPLTPPVPTGGDAGGQKTPPGAGGVHCE